MWVELTSDEKSLLEELEDDIMTQILTPDEIACLMQGLEEGPIDKEEIDDSLSLPIYMYIQVSSGECLMVEILESNVVEIFGSFERKESNLYAAVEYLYGEHEVLQRDISHSEVMRRIGGRYKANLRLKAELESIELLLEDYPEYKI